MAVINEDKMLAVLDWAYDKAINGLPGLETAQELAEDYLKNDGTLKEKVNSLIRWQNTKCGTSGFLSGIGGFMTLPIAVPANISSVIYVQLRMVAAIAYMGGYDIKDDKVRTLAYVCLCGNAAKDILKGVGVKVGSKVTENVIKSISKDVIIKINQRVGFRLVTKFGEKGVLVLSRSIPIVSGLICATLDVMATNTIGNVARDTFIQ